MWESLLCLPACCTARTAAACSMWPPPQAQARFGGELDKKQALLGEQARKLDALSEQLATSRRACEAAEACASGLRDDLSVRQEELSAAQGAVDDLQAKLQEVAAEKVSCVQGW